MQCYRCNGKLSEIAMRSMAGSKNITVLCRKCLDEFAELNKQVQERTVKMRSKVHCHKCNTDNEPLLRNGYKDGEFVLCYLCMREVQDYEGNDSMASTPETIKCKLDIEVDETGLDRLKERLCEIAKVPTKADDVIALCEYYKNTIYDNLPPTAEEFFNILQHVYPLPFSMTPISNDDDFRHLRHADIAPKIGWGEAFEFLCKEAWREKEKNKKDDSE